MKIEQGLQCVSKGPGGHYVVGQSGKAAAVAEFELLFPKGGKIARLLSDLTVAIIYSAAYTAFGKIKL